GLRPEDVIVALDGVPVGYSAELQAKIAQHHPGDQVTLMVYRDRRARDIKVRLDEAPLNEPAQRTAENTVHSEERLGIQVAVLDNATAREYEYPEAGGVIITSVARGSAAARRGLGQYIGGKLAQVNDRDIETPADLRRALDAVGGGEIVSLHIEAPDGSSRVVNVRMPN
ncbi:MAG: PDZ domain-containing protein, partial [Gemmatimonadota bacterium]|nr:PDZ domain-containing protein [Gemmatimonadota bacterium]